MDMEVNTFDLCVHVHGLHSDDLPTLIETARPHLIHSHNAPNTLTLAALDLVNDIPVIHDVHEVLSIHHSGFQIDDTAKSLEQYQQAEKRANEESDARIYATTGIKNYLETQYKIESNHNMVFRNYPLRSTFPQTTKSIRPLHPGNDIHIVYVGCVTDIVRESHYYLKPIFQKIADQRIHIHIYPTSDTITKSNDSYRLLGSTNDFIHFHQHINRKSLLKTLPRYHYGWVGLNDKVNHTHLDIALPNKVIEYIACGLPVITFPHRTIANFIETYHTGIVLSDIRELRPCLNQVKYSELRDNVRTQRHNFTIEQQIPDLVRLYKDLSPFALDVDSDSIS